MKFTFIIIEFLGLPKMYKDKDAQICPSIPFHENF